MITTISLLFISITTMILFFRSDVKEEKSDVEENNLGWVDELIDNVLKSEYEY